MNAATTLRGPCCSVDLASFLRLPPYLARTCWRSPSLPSAVLAPTARWAPFGPYRPKLCRQGASGRGWDSSTLSATSGPTLLLGSGSILTRKRGIFCQDWRTLGLYLLA